MRLKFQDLKLQYTDESKTLETTLVLRYRDRETSCTFDNMTSALTFLMQNNMLPSEEYLADRPKLQLPGPDRELRGLEGTAVDGVTQQQLLDAWRAKQGDRQLVIVVDVNNPALLKEFDRIDWS